MQVNTLQVVLTTNGERSFTLFIYTDVQWGEGGIGFNAGDGVRFYELPGSRTPEAREVEDSSNVGVEGVYAYRVDDETGIIGPEVEHYEGETHLILVQVVGPHSLVPGLLLPMHEARGRIASYPGSSSPCTRPGAA